MFDVLANAVFINLDFFRPKIGHQVVMLVTDDHVEQNLTRCRPDHRYLICLRRILRRKELRAHSDAQR